MKQKYYIGAPPYRIYELYHHGILGMHWGIRRFQNKDGSLTAAGKKRYNKPESGEKKSSLSSSRSELHKSLPQSSKFILGLGLVDRESAKSILADSAKKIAKNILKDNGKYSNISDDELRELVLMEYAWEPIHRFLKEGQNQASKLDVDGVYFDRELTNIIVEEYAHDFVDLVEKEYKKLG